MKELNRETYKAWIMEAFDLDEVRRKENIPEDDEFYWEDEGFGLDELTAGDGLTLRLFGIHEEGLDIELWKYKDKGAVVKKKHVDKIVVVPMGSSKDYKYYLLKFIPENIPDLQLEAEEWMEQKAKIDLETWLEQESKN